jgi:uncharacterized sulfatase
MQNLAALTIVLGLAIDSGALAAPPNVVLIVSDDQAWSDYGFMGHAHLQTPNLDRLATESLTFTRGYVPTSLCRPSLASIITGLYPHQHRNVGNDPAPLPGVSAQASQTAPEYQQRRAELIAHIDRWPTLPRLLATRGYVSFQAGKWWEGSYQRGGFTHGMTRGFPGPGGRHGDDGLQIGREGLEPVLEFMQSAAAAEQPFFVWYAPMMPHAPHDPPQRLLDRYRDLAPSLPIAKYWAMCHWFDETCGQLLGFIQQQAWRDNTLVVYVTDNGWINLPNQSGFAPRSKRSPYEGGIRTPIMLRYPGQINPQIDDSTLVSSLDLAPTILRACGLTPPNDMPGIDLRDEAARRQRTTLFGEIFTHDIASVERPIDSLRYRWAIRLPWKLIEPQSPQVTDEPVQLYHLLDDPSESNNLAASQPDHVAALRAELNAWWP